MGVSWERGDVCFEGRHRGMWLFCVVTGSQQLTIWTSNGETSKSVPDVLFFLLDVGVGTFFITAESLFDYQFWVISNWHSTVRLCERIAFGVIPKPSRRVAGAVFLMLDHSGHSVSCRPARTVLSISELQKRNPYGFQTWPNLELETHYRQSHSRQSFAFVRGSWELCKMIGHPGERICSSANSGLTRQWGCPCPSQRAGTRSHSAFEFRLSLMQLRFLWWRNNLTSLPSLWWLTMSERSSSSELTDPCGCRVDSRKEGPC